LDSSTLPIPEFRPHPLVRGGHAQTIVGNYLAGRLAPYRAAARNLELGGGDRAVLHDDRPDGWRDGDRVALLIHGLAGCHQSPYMNRIAAKLALAGVRAFRMDLRNCGSGQGLSRLPYHAGRSEDALAAVRAIAQWCPNSPVGIAGFSLGGNIVLKMLGEAAGDVPECVDRAVTVCPALDLARCVDGLRRPGFGLYDRHFVRLLARQLEASRLLLPSIPAANFSRLPRRIEEFDESYTAPVCGFGTAARYYAACSAARFVSSIRVQTLILASRDDPLIPVEIFERLVPSPATTVYITPSGGHLGYVARRGADPDSRWMDWRVVDWIGSFCQK
jgi:predicted alpha/beta-fold hydrolase